MKKLIMSAVTLSLLVGPVYAQSVTFRSDDEVKIKQWKGPSDRVRVKEKFTVGGEVPSSVTIREFPSDVGVSYSYVYDENDRVVVIEPKTRKVVRIIER